MQVWMEEQAIQTKEEQDARVEFRAELARQAQKWQKMMVDPDYLAEQQELPPHMR